MNSDKETVTMTNTASIEKQGSMWSDWLRENGGRLLIFARQQSRSAHDAEDILQEALVKLAKKVGDGSFDGGQNAWLPYVYTSIRRCAIDLGRKEDRRRKREEKVEGDKFLHTGGSIDPWFALGGDLESKSFIETSLKALPKKFSEVIVMKIWGERTFAEIGETLEISQNTAASRYRYGLEALRKLLSKAKKAGDLSINA